MKKAFFFVRVLALLGIIAASAFSQTAQLTGTVTDSQGALIPGARVVATNLDTGGARESITNDPSNHLITYSWR